jgi:hypothetical protein
MLTHQTSKSLRVANSIYIPSTRKGLLYELVPLAKCRWEGPPAGNESQTFRTFKSSKDVYPGNKSWFCNVLKLWDANLQDLTEETKSFKAGDSLKHITSTYHTIETLLEEDDKKDPTPLDLYRDDKIFPVSKNWNIDTN